jgi:hypothetical protein
VSGQQAWLLFRPQILMCLLDEWRCDELDLLPQKLKRLKAATTVHTA